MTPTSSSPVGWARSVCLRSVGLALVILLACAGPVPRVAIGRQGVWTLPTPPFPGGACGRAPIPSKGA